LMASEFNNNLCNLKRKTRKWLKGKRQRDEEALKKIDGELEQME